MLSEIVPYAVPLALSPLPAIAGIMLLLAPAGLRGGAGFVAGRFGALAVILLVLGAAAGHLLEGGGAQDRLVWPRLLLGVALVIGAGVLWARRPKDGAAAPPRWMRSLEGLGPAGALRFAAILTLANVKELAFVIAAALWLAQAELPAGRAVAAAGLFAGLGSLGVFLPFLWLLAGGARGGLVAVRDWLVRHNSAVMAAVLLLIGAAMIAKALSGTGSA